MDLVSFGIISNQMKIKNIKEIVIGILIIIGAAALMWLVRNDN